jgi:hypothetical protein
MFNRRARSLKGQLARYEKVINDSNTPRVAFVRFPGYKIAGIPLVSMEYIDCNAVVLFGEEIGCIANLAAVSHYNQEKAPRDYVAQLIEEMKRRVIKNSLVSVLIGGDKEHFTKNAAALRELEIPIANFYCDNLPEKWDTKVRKAGIKDLVVIPTTREVFMMLRKTSSLVNLSPYS